MKQTISLIIIISLLAAGSYMFFEPELIKAVGDETAVSLTVTTEITLSCSSTCVMTGTINSITGGTANGDFTCTVTTPDTSGWNLTIKKDQLLQTAGGGANKEFSDYATSTPLSYDYDAPGNGNETFGFNLASSTIAAVDDFTDNGADTCGSGSVSDDHCWSYFPTTPTTEKVCSTSTPAASGAAVNFGLRAVAGGSNALLEGGYAATTTVTATIGE